VGTDEGELFKGMTGRSIPKIGGPHERHEELKQKAGQEIGSQSLESCVESTLDQGWRSGCDHRVKAGKQGSKSRRAKAKEPPGREALCKRNLRNLMIQY
jgi:hypothetical protein